MDLFEKLCSAVYARILIELLEEFGVAKTDALKDTGIKIEQLEEPKGQITINQQFALYRNAVRLSPKSDIGLTLGMREQIHHHGIYGYAMLSSANFEQALYLFERFNTLAGYPLSVTIVASETSYKIRIHSLILLGSLSRILFDELIAALYSSLGQITSDKFQFESVSLSMAKPDSTSVYESLFGCSVNFNSDATEILIDKKWGKVPLETSNPQTLELCTEHCERMLRILDTESSFIDEVHQGILQLPTHYRRAERVAELLGISPRHLRRRLSNCNTNFREVLNKVRQELAEDYLLNSTYTIEDIAPLLGFTETTNFRRAFKKWSSVSPSEFRELAKKRKHSID